MSAHVLLNLLNEFGKRDKMRGLLSILSLFCNEFDKFNNTRARMLDSFYYIPINDTSFELSVFWLSDTESRINELRFSDSVSLSFKTRLTSVTCFCVDVT